MSTRHSPLVATGLFVFRFSLLLENIFSSSGESFDVAASDPPFVTGFHPFMPSRVLIAINESGRLAFFLVIVLTAIQRLLLVHSILISSSLLIIFTVVQGGKAFVVLSSVLFQSISNL